MIDLFTINLIISIGVARDLSTDLSAAGKKDKLMKKMNFYLLGGSVYSRQFATPPNRAKILYQLFFYVSSLEKNVNKRADYYKLLRHPFLDAGENIQEVNVTPFILEMIRYSQETSPRDT